MPLLILSNRPLTLALIALLTLLLGSCATVDRVRGAVTSVTNSVTPIRSAPEPVRSPLYYICDAKTETRTWECRTTRTSDGAVVDDPYPGSEAPPSETTSSRTLKAPAQPADDLPVGASAPTGTTPAPRASVNTILDARPDAWAVQLIALNNESTVRSYAAELGIAEPLYAQTRGPGDTLYVLLLGIHKDRETAEAARATFVANTTVEVNPWVRPLAPLQQAVRALSAN
jgi:septal ring-binding cell division protein DamX